MELNDQQKKLISDFAAKFCNHSSEGTVHPSCHISDVRALVDSCLQATDNTPAKETATPDTDKE